MATNSGRGNPIAAADGPPIQNTATPPHVSETLKSEIRQEAKAKEISGISPGLHATGQDADAAPPGAHVETVDEVAGQGRE
jgi:valyl-tRNA synthetase